ncbi:unnamed protein product, partial [Rotaria sordida]
RSSTNDILQTCLNNLPRKLFVT